MELGFNLDRKNNLHLFSSSKKLRNTNTHILSKSDINDFVASNFEEF